MSGLFALLDDVAALVKLTASSLDDIAGATGRASVKAAGVVVDDTAVTPRYVQEPSRSGSCRSSGASPRDRCATSC